MYTPEECFSPYAEQDISDDVFSKIIESGHDINTPNRCGFVMMHYRMCTHKLILMLKHGADVNMQCGEEGATPLMNVIHRCDASETECCQILLDHGADITIKDRYGGDCFDVLNRICNWQSKYIKMYESGMFIKNEKYERCVTFMKQHDVYLTMLNMHRQKTITLHSLMLPVLDDYNTNKKQRTQ